MPGASVQQCIVIFAHCCSHLGTRKNAACAPWQGLMAHWCAAAKGGEEPPRSSRSARRKQKKRQLRRMGLLPAKAPIAQKRWALLAVVDSFWSQGQAGMCRPRGGFRAGKRCETLYDLPPLVTMAAETHGPAASQGSPAQKRWALSVLPQSLWLLKPSLEEGHRRSKGEGGKGHIRDKAACQFMSLF